MYAYACVRLCVCLCVQVHKYIYECIRFCYVLFLSHNTCIKYDIYICYGSGWIDMKTCRHVDMHFGCRAYKYFIFYLS